MSESELKEWLEKYPYLKDYAKTTLFESEEIFNNIKNGETITINNEKISIEFLKKILSEEKYYDYANKYFNKEIPNFAVSYIIYGDTGGSIFYNRAKIIIAIQELINNNKLSLTSEQQQRFEALKSMVSFEKFMSDFNDKEYNVKIDNNEYNIPVDDIIKLMQMDDKSFDDLCNNNDIKNINGIPKEHFIFASVRFLKENQLLDNYVFSNNIIKRYRDIMSLQKIDLQALNKHLETTDTKYKEVNLNEELKQKILEGMPQDISNLDKAIYIYIKMCKLLTYDDEYYAVNQRGVATLKHKDVNYITTITPEKNEVVCFEFNLMYSKLLSELGINFASDYKNMFEDSYGEGHASLEFRSDKFIVNADSVTSILHGDLMQAKLNQKLVGLECKNKNEQTKKEFNDELSKMYQLIAEQERKEDKTEKVEHTQTLEELLYEYCKSTDNIKSVDLDEKLSILIDKVNSKKMVGIDNLSYLLQLRKILFTDDERKDNISISVIRDNNDEKDEKVATSRAIISMNREGFDNNPESNIYYYYNPNHDLVQIPKEQLQEMFEKQLLEYIEKDDPRIPSIVESVGIKR